jgi:hypothetical protein
MSQANREMEAMRSKMTASVEKLSAQDLKAMLLRSIELASMFEMQEMAMVTSFASFKAMDFELDLTA